MAQYTLVKRAVAAYHLDGPDEGAEPDRHKVTGNITFTPMLRPGEAVTMIEDDRPITLVPLPVEARISDGVIFHRGVEGVMLLAGGEKMNPDKLLWKAEFKHLQSNGRSFSLTPVVFEAVPGGEVDLSLVAPPPGKPVGTIRGRDGDTIEGMGHEGGELVLTIRHGDGKTSERRVDVRAVAEGVAGEALSDARKYAGTVAEAMPQFEELQRQTAADCVSAGESAGASASSASAAAGSASEARHSADSATSSVSEAESHAEKAEFYTSEAAARSLEAEESAKSAYASVEAAANDAARAKKEADRATSEAGKAATSATSASKSAAAAAASADRVGTAEQLDRWATETKAAAKTAASAAETAKTAAASVESVAADAKTARAAAGKAVSSAAAAKSSEDKAADYAAVAVAAAEVFRGEGGDGGGAPQANFVAVAELPANPDPNVIYLVG